jgi:hypothetical protein
MGDVPPVWAARCRSVDLLFGVVEIPTQPTLRRRAPVCQFVTYYESQTSFADRDV